MQIMEAGKDVEKKTEMYVPYNILPLDPAGANKQLCSFLRLVAMEIQLVGFIDIPCKYSIVNLNTVVFMTTDVSGKQC